MTDFADRVEQDRVAILRRRFSGRKGQALSGRGSRPADRPAAGPWPTRLPNPTEPETGAKRRQPRSGSAEPARCRRRGRVGRHDRGIQARARSGRPPRVSRHEPPGVEAAWRSSTRAEFVRRPDRCRTPGEAWPRARPESSCRGARRASSGSPSTRPTAFSAAGHDAALRAAQQLVAREEHEVGPGGDSAGGGRLVADVRAAGPARALRSRCRQSSTEPLSWASCARSASPASSVKPTIRKLLRWTRKIAAVWGPMARS